VKEWVSLYLAVQALSLATLPMTWTLFSRLPDRGYFFAKTLGILLHSVLFWVSFSLGLLRNEAGGAVLAALVLVVSARWGWDAGRRASLVGWLRENRAVWLLAEGLFLVAFTGWSVVRAFDPAADHTERPMDLLLLTGLRASPTFPPQDPWLAGCAISYYYLGHWMLNALGLLSGAPPAILYNLGQACWYGLLLSGCFGIGFNLARYDRPASVRGAMAAGALAAVSVGLAANPQGTLDVLQRQGLSLRSFAHGAAARNFAPPPDHLWWWRSSRVVADHDAAGQPLEVIGEFPAFSYVVGDAHAHLLAMPFVVLVVALALQLFLDRPAAPNPAALHLLVLVAAVGSLLALNTWDFPGQWLLVVTAAFLARGGRRAIRLAVVVLAASFVLYLPHLLTAQTQAEGFRLNRHHPTPLVPFLLMWGPHLLATVVLIGSSIRDAPPRPARVVGIASTVVAVPALALASAAHGADGALIVERWRAYPWTLVVLGVLLSAAAACLLPGREGRRPPPARAFALLLGVFGLGLLLATETVYVQDSFGTRMNTVFKVGYQAWLLLGLAGSFAVAASLRERGGLRVLAGATLVVVLSSLAYTGAAVRSVTSGSLASGLTLDALEYVRRDAPDEWAVIEWARSQTAPQARVLQAPGSSYDASQSRLSVATGRPTLIGWEGHERQWRGRQFDAMAAGRAEALEAVYGAADPEGIRRALLGWRIDYVFVGDAERLRYGIDEEREARIAQAMDLAFSSGAVRLYRRRGLGP
jgi:YYY domain-containing protein